MNILLWFNRKKIERAKYEAEKEAKIRAIHNQIFKRADEAEKITKNVNDLMKGNEVDIAHQIFLATRRGKKQ